MVCLSHGHLDLQPSACLTTRAHALAIAFAPAAAPPRRTCVGRSSTRSSGWRSGQTRPVRPAWHRQPALASALGPSAAPKGLSTAVPRAHIPNRPGAWPLPKPRGRRC
jgi:hypothetical protein